jgi:putative phosphoesterase
LEFYHWSLIIFFKLTSVRILYTVILINMKIGILSDTHLASITEDFKETIKRVFDGVDMIIHAGDITGLSVFNYLSNWELKAVRGNMDDFDLYNLLPEKRIENIMGKNVGIIHGKGPPRGIEEVVLREFQNVDLIIYGHSHVPLETKKRDVLLFNPGSYRRSYSYHGTVGMLEIADNITLRHIEVE